MEVRVLKLTRNAFLVWTLKPPQMAIYENNLNPSVILTRRFFQFKWCQGSLEWSTGQHERSQYHSMDNFWERSRLLNRALTLISPKKLSSDLLMTAQTSNLLKKWAIPGLFFSLFSSFQYTVDSKQMFNINKFLLMTGFEPRTSGIGSDRSTNWATTTAH